MNRLKTSLLATASLLAASGTASAGQTWDLPTAYPASNFHTATIRDFATCVSEGTKGEINIMIHANNSLKKGGEIKRAVQTGQVQIGERLLSSHENENAVFGTDSVPFLANTYEDSVRLYAAAKPEIEKVLDGQGLKLVYSVPWPPQGLYFKKEVNSVSDMAGIRVRSYNNETARLSQLTSMSPVAIEAAEISQAISAGVISSLITSSVTGRDSKAWEQLSYFYEVKAWMPRNFVIVNKRIWDGLTDGSKAAFTDCATKAEMLGLDRSKQANADALEALKNNGIKVLPPSEKLAEELRKIGETMAKEWATKAGVAGSNILSKYKAIN